MKNRFDLSELYTRFIQLFEISGIEDVFDDDHDDDHVPYGEKMVIRVTPEKTLSCNVLSERLTIDLYPRNSRRRQGAARHAAQPSNALAFSAEVHS